ncbi:MAG: prolipoprotein diacylglyceryl transferase family protein [Bacteroidales bacterium]|nr:prolipoprotein diacylglyceryl transferase family protein [Bacteroidales bacterium]
MGILLAVWIFVRKKNKPYIWALDRIAIVVALAGVLIRLGNLMNSEIYGVETIVSWGFVFLRNGENAPKHPTQIYEALTYLVIFLVLIRIYWRKKREVYSRGSNCLVFCTRLYCQILY